MPPPPVPGPVKTVGVCWRTLSGALYGVSFLLFFLLSVSLRCARI